MRNVTEVHKEYLDNLEVMRFLEEQKILFSDKDSYDKLLTLLMERNNVLSWVLENN
jgi:hypothetical protein